MSAEKRSVTQGGVLKEKVEGLTLKISRFVRECHTVFIPHIPKIMTHAQMANRSRKG